MALLDDSLSAVDALERVARLRRRARDVALAASLLAAAGATAASLGHGEIGFAALVGAAVGFGAAGLARAERRTVLTRLVAAGIDGAEVRPFAAELVSPSLRRRLARGLEVAAAAGRPGLHEYTHVRPERAGAVRDDLLELAAAFRNPARPVTPASAALCRRLICEASVSPLYNPALPDQELTRTLRAIGAGFDRS